VLALDLHGGAAFAQKPRHGLRLTTPHRPQELEREVVAEQHVLGFEDHGHAALAEHVQDPVLVVDDIAFADGQRLYGFWHGRAAIWAKGYHARSRPGEQGAARRARQPPDSRDSLRRWAKGAGE